MHKTSHVKIFLILLGLLLTSGNLLAQNGGFAGSFTRMGFGPRGMAMGNAMTAVSEQGAFAYYNPALSANKKDFKQVDLSTAVMNFDRSLHFLNIAIPMPPSAGINLSLLNANVSEIDGRTQSGYHTGYLSTHEYQLSTTFGIRASEQLYLGTSIKFNMADYHSELVNSTGFGFDLGMLYRPAKKLDIGLTVKDLLAAYNWDTSNLYNLEGSRSVANQFPTRFILGASYNIREKWVVSLDYEIRAQSSTVESEQTTTVGGTPQIVRDTRTLNTNSQQLRIGSFHRIHERVTIRAGYQIEELERSGESGHFSSGFSIHLPFDKFSPSVDYAFIQEPGGFSNFHVFSLKFNI